MHVSQNVKRAIFFCYSYYVLLILNVVVPRKAVVEGCFCISDRANRLSVDTFAMRNGDRVSSVTFKIFFVFMETSNAIWQHPLPKSVTWRLLMYKERKMHLCVIKIRFGYGLL